MTDETAQEPMGWIILARNPKNDRACWPEWEPLGEGDDGLLRHSWATVFPTSDAAMGALRAAADCVLAEGFKGVECKILAVAAPGVDLSVL